MKSIVGTLVILEDKGTRKRLYCFPKAERTKAEAIAAAARLTKRGIDKHVTTTATETAEGWLIGIPGEWWCVTRA